MVLTALSTLLLLAQLHLSTPLTYASLLLLLAHSPLSTPFTHSSLWTKFPLRVPADIQQHFSNVTRVKLPPPVLSPLRLPRSTGRLPLRVPPAVQDYLRERRETRRSGRQIVPGVYSCGHQGKDQFINFINPHYPSNDNVAGTCHFRLVTSDPGVCQVSRLRSH